MKEEIEEQEKEIDEQDKEIEKLKQKLDKLKEKTPPIYFPEEEYTKLYTFKWMLENELEKAEEKKADMEIQLTEKEHELQETKDLLKEN